MTSAHEQVHPRSEHEEIGGQIKATVAGRRPDDARADVWLVHETDRERQLPLRVGDEVVLRLPEIPSSGYAWTLERSAFAALELVEEVTEPSDDHDDVYGGRSTRRVLLRATTPGVDDIVVALSRPWEPEPIEKVVVHVHVAGEPTGDAASWGQPPSRPSSACWRSNMT